MRTTSISTPITDLMGERDALQAERDSLRSQLRYVTTCALLLSELADHVAACQIDLACPSCGMYSAARQSLTEEVGR